MQVFISWSGARSHAVASLLDEWLQSVIQAIDPWMSSKNIDRGSLWFSEINDQLMDTEIGIVCLTRDNLDKPWILFESGALAKGLSSSRVCTLLIDLEYTDVSNPLAQFNHTVPDEAGMFELVRTLNNQLGEQGLKEKMLEQVFETYWPRFKEGFDVALNKNVADTHRKHRTEESLLTEILQTTRSLERNIRNIEATNLAEQIATYPRGKLLPGSSTSVTRSLLALGIPVSEILHIMRDRVTGGSAEYHLDKVIDQSNKE